MPHPVHIEAIEHILSAIYARGDTVLSSFLFGSPGAPSRERRLGAEIFTRRKKYIRALLFVRKSGAPYLREISVGDLWSMVTSFITENFWYIRAGMIGSPSGVSYAEQTSMEDKIAMAKALATSSMFSPKSELMLYPLLPIRVKANFESEFFFIFDAKNFSMSQLPSGVKAEDLNPTQFPPITRWDGQKQLTTSWLGVRSPLPQISDKMAAAILGAVALTPLPRERYLFSMRNMFGGQCKISDSWVISPSNDPHTPAMMHDIVLTEADQEWLEVLALMLKADDRQSKAQLRALEYFYRAWFLNPRERFPALCMALDSLVGVSHRHTAAAVAYVKGMVSSAIDDERLRLLMRVRGAVIHGAAPDVYDSEHYGKYYVDYETDPIRDLELIVAKCLRKAIFGGSLKYHADPNADLLVNLQATGRLPAKLSEGSIIPDTD